MCRLQRAQLRCGERAGELTLQSSGIGYVQYVSRITVVEDLIGNDKSSSLQLRKHFKAEMWRAWCPSCPAIIYKVLVKDFSY